MSLHPRFVLLAMKLEEAATALSHSDISRRLSDALSDKLRGTGDYGYIHDVFGDDESGDVVYSRNGDLKKAPYSMGTDSGKPMCSIDCASEKDVLPVTTYEEEADEADDADHVASMESQKLYAPGTNIRLIERYISKSDREAMPKEDFAGKGTSYPIKSAEDVTAAVHALGRAGSGNLSMKSIKARIIAIAKRKGFEGSLPKSWREAKAPVTESLKLVESAATLEVIALREAKADYEIKLIAPGKGSTAFYPSEVLKRDGPGVFKAGTHVYLNHPTLAEEAARPEGDVKNLAGVLTTAASYQESHSKGPGLYARMKVFADHAQTVEEKAPHVGMSIRASGIQESGKTRDGVPVLKQLTSAESVDVVTHAGAGGMILTEAARTAISGITDVTDLRSNEGQVEMDEAVVKKLIESAVSEATAPLKARALRGDATVLATRLMAGIPSLSESQRGYIVAQALGHELPLKEGALDEEKFSTILVAEAKRYAATLSGGAQVTGMGIGLFEAPKKKKAKTDDEDDEDDDVKEAARTEKAEHAEMVALYESAFGMSKVQAEAAAKGRAA